MLQSHSFFGQSFALAITHSVFTQTRAIGEHDYKLPQLRTLTSQLSPGLKKAAVYASQVGSVHVHRHRTLEMSMNLPGQGNFTTFSDKPKPLGWCFATALTL